MTGAKRINLALQGGGAHGAVTWGVIDRLLEDERIEFEGVSGASAGAVNAVALAYGIHCGGRAGGRDALDALWRRMSEVGSVFSPVRRTPLEVAFGDFNLDDSPSYLMFEAFTRLFSPYQFNPFDFNPLKDILTEIVDFERLRECTKTKLFLSATNVRSGKAHVFRTKDASIEAVLASTCLPFLFKAVEIDGEAYWDGGYMGNPVLFPFFNETKSEDVVIVHVNPIERDEVPKTASDIMNRLNEITFNSSLLRELRAVNFVQRLLANGWLKEEFADRLHNVRIHSIRSDMALDELSVASKFNVDWSFLSTLKARGRAIAADWLDENFDGLGVRSTVDVRKLFDGGASSRAP